MRGLAGAGLAALLAASLPTVTQTAMAQTAVAQTASDRAAGVHGGGLGDVASAGGFRSSRLVGASVYDEHDEAIATVDDLIVSDRQPNEVILSVGGLLGVGDRLVALPFARLRIHDNTVTLPGATKAGLKAMPEFHYVKNS